MDSNSNPDPLQNNKRVTVVIGAQWGNEGKGNVVDLLAEDADVICRCQGGNNANHTITTNKSSYCFNLLPSGVINSKCISIIGNGVVIYVPRLLEELSCSVIEETGTLKDRLFISDKAHLVFDLHQEVDRFQEKDGSGFKKIGTTKKGIGPTYSSKVTRNGIRMVDLIDDFSHFSEKFRALVNLYERMFPDLVIDIESELKKYKQYAEILRPYIKETVHVMDACIKANKNILVEGANAALLDIDFGTYPYVTSSNCSVGGISTGLGIPPTKIGNVIGVTKAYTTRDGDGPFPTELHDDVSEYLILKGKEIHPTTNEKRRCGWLDLFALRFSDMVNSYSAIALTKLDVLDDLRDIKIGIGYVLKGAKLDHFPSNASDLSLVEVEYLTLPGWLSCTKNVKCYSDLPLNAKTYIETIQTNLDVPIQWVGVGDHKQSLIII